MDLSVFGLEALNERILMENAERLGREERRLIGQKHPVQPLPSLSLAAAATRRLSASDSLLSSAALQRDGCLGMIDVCMMSASLGGRRHRLSSHFLCNPLIPPSHLT